MDDLANWVEAKPNDPCPCGSGVRFKFCHLTILSAPLDKVLNVGRAQYARAWANNARHYEERGYYSFLADAVKKHHPTRILDIGCGLGQGLSALLGILPADRFMISVEENPECLHGAADLLRGVGVKATVIQRLASVHVPGSRDYDLVYDEDKLSVQSDVTLIQSDILHDPELENFLSTLQPFDAITLWFTGVHKARQGLRRLGGLNVDSGHRELAEARVFEMGRKYVRKGGIVHIGERGWAKDVEAFKIQRQKQFQDNIAGRGFSVSPVATIPYTEPTAWNRIGVGSKIVDVTQFGVSWLVNSITAIKED